MNADQRKFLIQKIEKTHNEKVEALQATLPDEPMLNNYLIGGFLENSIKILEADTIKKNIRKFVQGLGGEEFVTVESHYRKDFDDEDENTISIPPDLIMELPVEYKEDWGAWKKKKDEIAKEIADLKTKKDTLVLQIQIGSNAILDKLITQVDSLGDLDLFSSKLSMIAEGIQNPEQKQLENKKKK